MVAQKCILLYTHVHRCAVSVFACVTNLLQKVEGETEGERERERDRRSERENESEDCARFHAHAYSCITIMPKLNIFIFHFSA